MVATNKQMKITKAKLQKIIKEEIEQTLVDRRQEAKAKIDDLMKSRLFSNADKEDKAEARSIIFDTMMSLESYGGTRRHVEEYMDDAFRPHTELKKRLAIAASEARRGFWLDALVAWSNGRKNYEELLYDEEVS